MSSFDSLALQCPHCKKTMHVQSKADSCNMETYDVYNAPLSIIADFEKRAITCENCQKQFHLVVQKIVGVQPLITT